MRRFGAVVVAACLASTLVLATPAKAYYADPGELLFAFVSGDWYLFMNIVYHTHNEQSGNQYGEESPTDDCATGAPIEIERKKSSGWVNVLSGKTNKKAKFKKKVPKAKPGKYRAHVLAYTTTDGNNCFEAYGNPKKFKG